MKKYYIWGFPGIGKSTVNSKFRIVDADCERFKYVLPADAPDSPHSPQNTAYTRRDPSFPQNYWDYVHSVDADVVLLNCHISLLGALDRERLLLVYPSPSLKEDYLRRYALRGDNRTYLRHMEAAFDGMAAAVRASPYRKYEITDPNTYLQDLIEKGMIMEQFITKKELADLLGKCVQLGVYAPEGPAAGKTPDELAQMLFEGGLSLDVAGLKNDLAARQAELDRERLLRDRRGGLSHEELSGRIMEGIVNGALNIRHTDVAPYSFGYEVTFRSAKHGVTYRCACYCSFPGVPEEITRKIESGTLTIDVPDLLAEIGSAEERKIKSFVLERDSGLQPRGSYTGHVASARDVHRGIALDGIIRGHYEGDYSSMTTGTENDTVRALVALKGFCLDCLHMLPSRPLIEFVTAYLKDHGTDVSTPEKLDDWIRRNPDKCALPENRERFSSCLEAEQAALGQKPKKFKRKNQCER